MHFTKKLICLLLCIAALALPLLSCDCLLYTSPSPRD